jgi:hypothetical protein
MSTAIPHDQRLFQALGADLKSTCEWLRHNVLELIKEVEIKTDKFVSGLEDKAHAAILIFKLAAGRIVEAVGNYGASLCMFNDALTDSGS